MEPCSIHQIPGQSKRSAECESPLLISGYESNLSPATAQHLDASPNTSSAPALAEKQNTLHFRKPALAQSPARMLCPGISGETEPPVPCPSSALSSFGHAFPDPGQGLDLPYLMNFRAKDFSFPVAAAAASSKSRLFPDSMWPRTPSSPSGDLEWSASIVWGRDRTLVLENTELPRYSLAAVSLSACLHSMGDHDLQFTLQLTPSWKSVP